MSKKTNFKKITALLVVLIAVLIIVKVKDSKQGDRSFKAFVVQIDTAGVDQITITPKGAKEKVILAKENDVWMLSLNDKKVQADDELIDDLLGQVCAMKTKSVAATSKDKWADYEVTDSTGSRISISKGKKKLTDFMLGKFSYKQPQGQNPYMQQQNVQMTSYLRLSDENEVYAVDGYLSMMFNRDASSFRSNNVLIGKPNTWKKLVYTYPADSSFSLVNQNGKWMVNGIMADSTAVDNYFSKVRMFSNSDFDNEAQITNGQQSEFSLRIEGDNFKPIEINAYRNSAGELLYTSSQNKGNIFKSDIIKETLFVGKKQFFVP